MAHVGANEWRLTIKVVKEAPAPSVLCWGFHLKCSDTKLVYVGGRDAVLAGKFFDPDPLLPLRLQHLPESN
jgi:hypothetical protein